jgi:hypothetical protein
MKSTRFLIIITFWWVTCMVAANERRSVMKMVSVQSLASSPHQILAAADSQECAAELMLGGREPLSL